MATKRFSVSLNEDTHKALEVLSKRDGQSKNEIINHAVNQYIDMQNGLFDYNEPALQRLNQIIDYLVGNVSKQDEMLESVSRLEGVLLRYLNGDNYYNEEDESEVVG